MNFALGFGERFSFFAREQFGELGFARGENFGNFAEHATAGDGCLRAPRGLTARERVLLQVVRVSQVVDRREKIPENFAIAGNTASWRFGITKESMTENRAALTPAETAACTEENAAGFTPILDGLDVRESIVFDLSAGSLMLGADPKACETTRLTRMESLSMMLDFTTLPARYRLTVKHLCYALLSGPLPPGERRVSTTTVVRIFEGCPIILVPKPRPVVRRPGSGHYSPLELQRVALLKAEQIWRTGRPVETREIFEKVALSPGLVEFLTIPAYEYLD